MEHKGTITIETGRLILRRFTPDDAEAMFRNWASDSEVTKFLTWPAHSELAVSKAVTKEWSECYVSPDYYQWAIVPKSEGEPIGGIGVVAKNEAVGMVHIGYCIGQKWWRKGYTSEALVALVRFFFEEVGVCRIESRHDPRNPNSGQVMKKAGLRFEGISRQSDYNNQGICDAANYAILAEDYFAQRNGVIFDIRPIDAETRPVVTEFLTGYWSGTFILIRGEAIDITAVDGFAAVENGRLIGVVTYIVRGEACEIVSLNSLTEKRGVGTILVSAVISRARELGCTRVQLLTTNDNLNAIGFYQKRGFELVGVNPGAIDRAREQKPSIPLIGQNGIPIRHELEFAMNLQEENI